MILPKKDKDGNYFISYSQINGWNEAKGFNTGAPGKQEYIRRYFLGERYDAGPFAVFGKEVEDYIATRSGADKFTEAERKVLDQIEPLGVFQHEFKLQYDGFYVWGFIDDRKADFKKIRDYKTGSVKSSAKYSEDGYDQLDLYALAIQQETGTIPEELEVCIIERTGNGFRGGRDVLKVGENVWYVQRKTHVERLANLEQKIQNTVKQISHTYEVFLKLNKC